MDNINLLTVTPTQNLTEVQEKFKPSITKLIEDQKSYDPFKDDDYLEAGTFLLSRFSKAKNTIEDQRLAFTKPLNDSLRAINSFFKQFSNPIEQADRELRDKLANHRKQLEEQKINEAEQKGENLVLRSKIGGVVVKKVWVFKVEDKEKIPHQFLAVDEVKIRAAIHAGIRQIDGVIIFQTERVSL